MPELEYNLSTGINQDNLFNVKLDTQERMRDLYEGFNIPDYQAPQPFVPKNVDTDTLVRGDVELPTLDEALDSKNPAVVQAAIDRMRQKAAKNPMSRGVGFDNEVQYQEGQNKFTQDHWWKEGVQTMYGFNPYKTVAENEDFIHHQVWDNYSIAGKTWRGVGTFAGRTLSKLVTGLVGTVGDIGAMAWNGLQEVGDLMNINDGTKNNFWDDVSNNWLARKMESADNYVKESILPTYKALDYDDKGAWSKLLDPYTWQTSFADGAGFLLQFAVPGALFGKAAQAGKLARSIGKFTTAEELATAAPNVAAKMAKAGMTIEEAKNVSGFTRLMGAEIGEATAGQRFAGGATEFLTGSKNVGGISAHIFNTSMESVAETKEGFNHTVEDLMNKGMSREEAVKIASENAPTQFWINMGILTASNAFTNKLLQKAVGNRSVGELKRIGDDLLLDVPKPSTKIGRFFENNKWGNRVKFYGGTASKAVLFEGYWEENAQTAAARYARGEYDRKGDDGGGREEVTGSFLQQLYKQTIDAAKGNDREAADSIMAGAVIGILGGTAFSKISGERKQTIENKAQLVADFTNTRDAWLSLNTLDPELYDKEGKIIPENAKKKAEEIAQKLDKIASVFKRTITAEALTNPQAREQLQHQVFGDFVKAHILNGTEQQLIEKLNSWGDKSEGELSLYGVSTEMKENAGKWASLAEELVKKWGEIKDIKFSAPKTENVNSYFAKSQALKSLIFDYTSLKYMSETLASSYKDLKDEINPFSRYPLQEGYNKTQAEIIALEQLIKVIDTPIEKQQLQDRVDRLKEEQKATKEGLMASNDTRDDGTGFLFPKSFDPKTFTEGDVKAINDYLEYQWHQSDHENSAITHQRLIDEYSDPENGIENYNKVVDYWSRVSAEKEKTAQDEEDTEVFEDTLESLDLELKDLEEQRKDAKTPEEVVEIDAKIADVNLRIQKLKEDFDKDEDDVDTDVDEDVDTDEDEPQLAVNDSIASTLVAIDTPFKTANKETINPKDKDGNMLFWKEQVLEGSYGHDLTTFVHHMAEENLKNPGRYQAYIIKDTEALLKQRLSKKEWEAWEISRKELGAIVVFKEKGKSGWVKFTEDVRKDKAIVAYSYNEVAFADKMEERIEGKMKKTGWSKKKVEAFYKEQWDIADKIRAMVIEDPTLQVPVSATVGSMGVFPFTYPDNAFERFAGFHERVVQIAKTNNEYPGFEAGDVLLEIPGSKTDNGKPFYIPVFMGNISIKDRLDTKNEVNNDIYYAIQALSNAKFDTKAEADVIIGNFLKKLFYVNKDIQYFRTIKDGGKFKIAYFRKDKDTGKEERVEKFIELPMKMLGSLYEGLKGQQLPIYKKNQTTGKFELSRTLSKEEYQDFVNNSLQTKRKVLVVTKGKTEKIYTSPVNAYLNLTEQGAASLVEQTDEAPEEKEEVPVTTEDALSAIFGAKPMTELELKIAKINEERQVELKRVNSMWAAGQRNKWKNIGVFDLQERLDDVNKKFDDQIAALTPTAPTQTPVDSTIEDIERRRQEELNNIFEKDDVKKALFNQEDARRILALAGNPTVGFRADDFNKAEQLFNKITDDYAKEINAKYDAEIMDFFIKEKSIKGSYLLTAKTDPRGTFDVIAQQINNVGVDPSGKIVFQDVDIRQNPAVRDMDPRLKDYVNKLFPQYKKVADEQDAKSPVITETVPDKEYDKFIDTGKVTKKRLESLANKVKNREMLSEREMAIFADKTGEINKIIADSVKTEPVQSLEELIEAKEKELEIAEINLSITKQSTTLPAGAKKMNTDRDTKLVDKLTAELAELKKLLPKEEEKPQTPLQKLRTKAAINITPEVTSNSVIIKVAKKEYLINFDTNVFQSASTITEDDIEKLKEFFENAHNYTPLALQINQKNVYLVKHNKLGKFVILDENFDAIPETKEMMKNKEYKDFKNCK